MLPKETLVELRPSVVAFLRKKDEVFEPMEIEAPDRNKFPSESRGLVFKNFDGSALRCKMKNWKIQAE